MSTNNIEPVVVYATTAVSGTDPVHSSALKIPLMSMAAFQAVWTGTLSGALIVEASLDGTNYSDIGLTVVSPSGSASSSIANLGNLAVKYIRMTYTNASGTGNLTIMGMGKRT